MSDQDPGEFSEADIDIVEADGEVDPDDEVDEDLMVLDEVDDELVLPMWEPTGEERVDEALELLSTLDVEDVHQHAPVYAEIHEKLRATLSNADASTG